LMKSRNRASGWITSTLTIYFLLGIYNYFKGFPGILKAKNF
jgi:hypothetical protein